MRNVSAVCLSVLVIGLALGGCGDDEEPSGSDAGGQGGGGGSGGSSGADASDPGLPDNTAGKACSSASECGGGTCATTVLGTMVGGNPLPAPGGYCTTSCAMSSECGAGGACIGAVAGFAEGTCMATCTDDASCRDGYLCGGGITILGVTIPDTCRPKPDTDQLGDDVAGAMCAEDGDCSGGSCLLERPTIGGAVPLPGGYCTGACLEDAHCGGGGICVDSILGGAGSCYEGCEADPDCTREGYRCRPLLGGVRGCNPAADPLPDNSAGDACASDTDCGGTMGTCASALPIAGIAGLLGQTSPAPGGYCSQPCLEQIDCGAGGVCLAGTCYAPCTVMTDCRDGYMCQERETGEMDPDAGLIAITVCAPEVVDDDDAGM